jgi:hypothetical protein
MVGVVFPARSPHPRPSRRPTRGLRPIPPVGGDDEVTIRQRALKPERLKPPHAGIEPGSAPQLNQLGGHDVCVSVSEPLAL